MNVRKGRVTIRMNHNSPVVFVSLVRCLQGRTNSAILRTVRFVTNTVFVDYLPVIYKFEFWKYDHTIFLFKNGLKQSKTPRTARIRVALISEPSRWHALPTPCQTTPEPHCLLSEDTCVYLLGAPVPPPRFKLTPVYPTPACVPPGNKD